ncbi:hypothetical protein [Yoonia sp. 2307UL14-13]|uniref:hypothetical protein n=1 Tax=Yoonia sp. 2307UL14-13 TaxID=3126506 RepID=UPI0030ADA0A9
MRLLFTFFTLPPWGYLLLAAAVFGLGVVDTRTTANTEAEKVAAREAGIPPVISLDDFDPNNLAPYDEVHIAAQINTDYNYELREGSATSSPYYMWVLVGPKANGQESVVQAAIVVPKRQKDDVVAWLNDQISDVGPLGAVMHLNGKHRTWTSHDDVAEDALTEEEGLRLAPDFFYLDPWFDGREAALAPRRADAATAAPLLNQIALVLAAIAAAKFVWRRRRRTNAAA